MANGTITLTSSRDVLEGRIIWESSSNGPISNNSYVQANLQIRRNDGYTTTGTWTGSLNVNGKSETFSFRASVGSSWVTVKSVNNTVNHNNNGTGSCQISGRCNGPSGTSMSGEYVDGSQTVALDKIPRYLTITSFTIASRTLNTVVVAWATSDPRSSTLFSLNGGAWTGSSTFGESLASDQKSGTFNIKNLNPNTTYKLKIKCIRTDSGLETESNEISFTTYDIAKLTEVPNVNIGKSHTIKWSNPTGAATKLKLCQTNGTLIIDYGTVTGTSKTITPTANTIYALTPNSNKYNAKYVITTTQNNVSYTNERSFTFNVTNSNPLFSKFTYADTNSKTTALTGNNQKLIKYYSNVTATISSADKAVAKNSAKMKSYILNIGNKSSGEIAYSSSANVTLSINAIESNTLSVLAKDSRGNSTQVSKTLGSTDYLSYSKIVIKGATLSRDTGGVGTRTTISYNGTFWNHSFGSVANSIVNISYQYKASGTSTWITGNTKLSPNISGNNFSQTIEIQGDLAGEGFNQSLNYDIKLNISDKLSSHSYQTILGSGQPLVAYHKNGVAIGQKYDTKRSEKLQVSGTMYSAGPHYFSSTGIKSLPSGTDGRDYWNHLENGIYWYGNTNAVENLPKSWGWIYKFGFVTTGDFTVLFFNQGSKNEIYRKEGNTSAVTNWQLINGDASSKGIKTLTGKGSTDWNGQADGDSYLITKAFMAFWDGSYSSKTHASNLQYFSGGQIQGVPKTLYNNSSGTTGTVTLSETSANFTYLEIYFGDSANGSPHNSTKVYSPNGKKVATTICSKSGTNIRINTRNLTISGTSVTQANGQVIFPPSASTYTVNEQKIYKIIGYKGG